MPYACVQGDDEPMPSLRTVTLSLGAAALSTVHAAKPNIMYILADDCAYRPAAVPSADRLPLTACTQYSPPNRRAQQILDGI